jgi:hypothetical protein
MEQLKWHTEQVKWADMIPYEKNARKIKAENKRSLDESLDEFDVVEIPVLDTDNLMIGGHQRRALMLANGRGEELTDVRKPNRKLTEHEFKKLNLLLNSDKFKGEYDLKMLEEFFSEFDLKDEFDIEMPDFDEHLDEMEAPAEPEMPIVQKFSEKYLAYVVVCENEIDATHIAEKLGIERGKSYKGGTNIAPMHVIRAEKLIETWK